MSAQMAMDLMYMALIAAAKLSGPVLLSTIVLGVVINILQTVTSMRDMTLTFIPKLIGAAVVMGLTLPWSVQVMTEMFQQTFSMFAAVTP